MRFGVPRSLSPSPVRRPRTSPPRRSAFGLPPDSSEDESEQSDSESIASSSSADSSCYEEEADILHAKPRSSRPGRSLEQQYLMEDTIASIRLRVKHRDAYEDWEHQARKDAFISARHAHHLNASQRRRSEVQSHRQLDTQRAALHDQQLAEVQDQLKKFRIKEHTVYQAINADFNKRNNELWVRVEAAIKIDEDKVKAKLEEERKLREAEERKRKEAEEKRRLEEERKRQEAERLRKEEEERQKQKQREEEEKKKQEEAERQRVAQEKAEEEERMKIGMTTAQQDWERARRSLKTLKQNPMKIVKGDKNLKSVWSAKRRQITPKIGQLTNDAQSIDRISREIIEIVAPTQSQSADVYYALLSSLSKSILLQAETEVTAEKRSAHPLGLVTTRLLYSLDSFAEIFWSKFVQRTGGWPVPYVIPSTDVDGTPLGTDKERRKVLGYREQESSGDYMSRVAGIMRVYFEVLFQKTPKPLDPAFSLSRYWVWFARMLAMPQLLESSVAPQLLYTALEVGGHQARGIWGHQWVKLLGILYEGVTTGLYGSSDRLIGGTTSEGIAARVRVQLEIERIMNEN